MRDEVKVVEAESALASGMLVVIPALPAVPIANTGFRITAKFLEGLRLLRSQWGADVRALMPLANGPDENLDPVEVPASERGLEIVLRTGNWQDTFASVQNASVVLLTLGAMGRGEPEFVTACHHAGLPVVLVSECSMLTQLQIVAASVRNPVHRLKRQLDVLRREWRNREVVKLAAGVQCNGTPTWEAYRKLSPSPMLFFDSRIDRSDLIRPEELEHRTAAMLGGGTLRMAFTGRLDRIKGVHLLPRIAKELINRNVDFTLDICGDGPERERLASAMRQQGLRARVTLRGTHDFRTSLLPFLKEHIDVFVCPHVQGDPSCTYLETFGCGIPVAGLENEAIEGLMTQSDAVWTASNVCNLARLIQRLSANRAEIAAKSWRAREFAAKHTSDQAFNRRVQHLVRVIQQEQTHMVE